MTFCAAVLVLCLFVNRNFKFLEFGPQLPPEGGTFYTHDAADLSRPYYKLSWPPLLQAAALWLGHVNNAGETIEPDNVYSNHFFLVFGTIYFKGTFPFSLVFSFPLLY